MNVPKIRFVCATREAREDFFTRTALGRSLALYRFPFVEYRVFDRNTRGLPTVYNEGIVESLANPAVLVFIHDDVHLCDFFWAGNILGGLQKFQVLGLVGNKRRLPKQPSWAFTDENLTSDALENLSGVIGHGKGFPSQSLAAFGPSAQKVKLLDGVMLVAHSETLARTKIRFDERFDFHFYDMDFCRQCEAKNVSMGTWPISVVHESGGGFGSPGWTSAYDKYLDKWQS